MIRLYGLIESLYILLAFPNPRVFSMEFIREKMSVEIEHFLKYKKSNDIKYPWVVGPFTIKNKCDFPMVEGLIRELVFETKPTLKYEPH